jgi:hypothetical protein
LHDLLYHLSFLSKEFPLSKRDGSNKLWIMCFSLVNFPTKPFYIILFLFLYAEWSRGCWYRWNSRYGHRRHQAVTFICEFLHFVAIIIKIYEFFTFAEPFIKFKLQALRKGYFGKLTKSQLIKNKWSPPLCNPPKISS